MKNKTKTGDTTRGRERENPIVQAFARRFRQWRHEQNKTIKNVAGDLGMSTAIISEWENCMRFPSVKTLQAVVEYTGVPAWAFFHLGEVGGVNPLSTKGKPRRLLGR